MRHHHHYHQRSDDTSNYRNAHRNQRKNQLVDFNQKE